MQRYKIAKQTALMFLKIKKRTFIKILFIFVNIFIIKRTAAVKYRCNLKHCDMRVDEGKVKGEGYSICNCTSKSSFYIFSRFI